MKANEVFEQLVLELKSKFISELKIANGLSKIHFNKFKSESIIMELDYDYFEWEELIENIDEDCNEMILINSELLNAYGDLIKNISPRIDRDELIDDKSNMHLQLNILPYYNDQGHIIMRNSVIKLDNFRYAYYPIICVDDAIEVLSKFLKEDT